MDLPKVLMVAPYGNTRNTSVLNKQKNIYKNEWKYTFKQKKKEVIQVITCWGGCLKGEKKKAGVCGLKFGKQLEEEYEETAGGTGGDGKQKSQTALVQQPNSQ